jgi:hypothetical protein
MNRNVLIPIIFFVAFFGQIKNSVASATRYAIQSDSTRQKLQDTDVYQLFPTENIWTFIKLNTRNGTMWQVQFGFEDNVRFQTVLNYIPLVPAEKEVNGRFTLYPTKNIYNFILLDQISGKTWQVQWSKNYEERAILPIE